MGSPYDRQLLYNAEAKMRSTGGKFQHPPSFQPYLFSSNRFKEPIVVGIDKSPLAVADTSRAIQSMLLKAWAEGLGSNWVGFHRLEAIKPLLNIPGELDVLAILPFGYPAQAVGQGKKQRKPIAEVAHREQFGQPFE